MCLMIGCGVSPRFPRDSCFCTRFVVWWVVADSPLFPVSCPSGCSIAHCRCVVPVSNSVRYVEVISNRVVTGGLLVGLPFGTAQKV